MIAHNPLLGSGQAAFRRPALTLGDNAHAAERIRMIDANRRQPADDESIHPIPRDTTGLATTQESAVPEPSDLDSKQMQRVDTHRRCGPDSCQTGAQAKDGSPGYTAATALADGRSLSESVGAGCGETGICGNCCGIATG